MCFPVRHVGERSLPATSKYGELEVVSRIRRSTIGGRAVSGPSLFFGVVALTTRRRGYECVRGWTQPIVSVHRPVPVDSDYERQAFGTLTTTLWMLDREFPDTDFTMEKPVFDTDTEQGPCLPDFLLKARRGSEVRTWVVEVMGFERSDYLAGKGGHARAHGGAGADHPHGWEAVRGGVDRGRPQGDRTNPCRHAMVVAWAKRHPGTDSLRAIGVRMRWFRLTGGPSIHLMTSSQCFFDRRQPT